MISRIEKNAEILRKQKITSTTKKVIIMFGTSIALLVLVLGIYDASQETIKLRGKTFNCINSGCSYEIKVKHTSDTTNIGFARISATVTVHLGEGLRRHDRVGSERIEYTLNGQEQKVLKGFLKTISKASSISVHVGKIDNSI
jgi:hypothetical protein